MGVEEITINPLEKVTDTTANPVPRCCYPACEECDRYVAVGDASYCTVQIVVTQQHLLLTEERLRRMDERLTELEKLVTDEILGIEEPPSSMLVCANCEHFKAPDRCRLHRMDVTPESYCNEGLFRP